MSDLELLLVFLKSAAVGLLVGLERERHEEAKAGLRTFTLIALAGTLLACLDEHMGGPWLLAAGLLVIGGMLVAAYTRQQPDQIDSGTTTIAAAVVTYGLGALLWQGHSTLAVALALAMTALLYFRSELHGATRQVSRQDLVSFLQFALLAFVLLPILPDHSYWSYDILNPYRIGLLVVLISGLNFAGYIALRLFGARRGVWLVGFFSGLASSTATTLIYARHADTRQASIPVAALVILVANLALLTRLIFIASLISPQVLAALWPVLVASLVLCGLYTVWCARSDRANSQLPALQITNPVELRTALGFALLFVLVALIVSWVNQRFGTPGVYGAAALSGLVDLDAISLSSFRLANSGGVTPHGAAIAITIAYLANLLFKFVLAWSIGSVKLALRIAPGFGAAAIAASALLLTA